MSKRGWLFGSALFGHLGDGERDRIESMGRTQRLAAGQEIFHKGDRPAAIYGLVEGEARVSAPSPDGRELTLRSLGPGDVFGEIGVFDRKPRSATVVAVQDVVLAVIDARDFRDYLRRHPDTALKLLELLARRLRTTTESLEDSAFLTISGRLARALLSLATESREGCWVVEVSSQTDLARMVGTNRESVNRQLRAWVAAGVIQQIGNRIKIRSRVDLEALVPPRLSRDQE